MSAPATSSRRRDVLVALGVFAATALVLGATHRAVGFVRDEGYYFTAAERYEGWFIELGRAVASGPAALRRVLGDEEIVRWWGYNPEHPALAKASFALSHLLLHRGFGVDEITAWRLPSFLFGGLLSLALFLLARPWGLAVAVLAPALFWTVPRHFFHGHLAAFDIPVAALWCVFLAAWSRAHRTGKGAWLAGVAFGLALVTKHNAFFLPFVVLLHWLVTGRGAHLPGAERPGPAGWVARIPRGAWAMALLGPLVLYALWPYLWHHPVERIAWWIRFHTAHVHYPWQYLGEVLRDPPFPWAYPLVLELLTVPAATLLVVLLGLAVWGARAAGRLLPAAWRLRPLDSHEWVILLGAAVALAPFLTTRAPIFGGVKHWMAAVGLACIPAAATLVAIARAALPSRPALLAAALAGLVLAPAAWQTARVHPFGTSAYNEVAGGLPGAASLGMQRQYWSNNVTAVLPWINERAPKGASIYFHEVNVESFRYYQRAGMIRPDLRYAWQPRDATIAAYQYHQEFRDREFEIWTELGTRTPSLTFALDETPQVVVYERPGLARLSR